MVKLRSRPSFHVQFDAAAGLRLEVRGSIVSDSPFVYRAPLQRSQRAYERFPRVAGHRCSERANGPPLGRSRLVGFLNDRISQDVDMVTLRVNYRFGGYAAPGTARY
jgi:hypothetical protein